MIVVKNLSKEFRVHQKEPGLSGSIKSLFHRKWIIKKALDQVSFEISEGEIVGLVGANGAGKTTLSKILAGIVHPTSGQASVLGHIPWERENHFRKQMSLIMGQKASLWWDLPALDSFLLLKEIYQIPQKDFHARLEYLSSALDIHDQLKVQLRRLSLGERMKAELMAALLHHPKIVYLDEPTIGLDLTAQNAIRQFLLQYRKDFKPIMILTSHYMEDIEKLCKRIIILKSGSIVYDGTLAHIENLYGRDRIINIHLEQPIPPPKMMELPKELGEILEISPTLFKIRCRREFIGQATSQLLANFPVHDISIEEVDIAETIENIQREGMNIHE